jgi:hypothetical protein
VWVSFDVMMGFAAGYGVRAIKGKAVSFYTLVCLARSGHEGVCWKDCFLGTSSLATDRRS